MTNVKNYDFLIIGGGIAGTSAAETIRSHDLNSSIALVTAEDQRLYSRVLLPHYLRNENSLESLFVRKAESYQEKNIQLLTSTKVTKVDTSSKTVTTAADEVLIYKKLLIASGGTVNKLTVAGNSLNGVVYLRTLGDALKIKEKIKHAREGLVVGSGFIGIEFAQSFIRNGLKTRAIIQDRYFWESNVGENLGKLLSEILERNGVEVFPETEVREFIGQDNLTAVKLSSGKEVNTTLAGVGIGIHFDLSYLKETNLAIKKAVVTNEYLETSEAGIWAAGDVAEFYDPILKKYHVLGNWANSSAQGRSVGINMTSQKQAFETASMYSINIFDFNFSMLGDTSQESSPEIIERGSLAEKKLARLFLHEDIVVGASLINLPIDRNILTKLIKEKTKVIASKEKLQDLNFDLNKLLGS